MRFQPILRRAFLAMAVAAATSLAVSVPAQANPAEDYVQGNINKGLAVLNNKQLSTEQRRSQFEGFLLGLTDMKRIADFTLGQYRRTASPVDLADSRAAYAASQKQRGLERLVREAERKHHAAITPQARGRTRRDHMAARAASEDHRRKHGVIMTKVGVRRRERYGKAR